ncbi:MAG: protein-L-isoaspartate O-methyltransferase, partial [Proteobacteria bacterium]|nr:protein-L-isoaspartate O-methyltransferase [Pseudomonadota bacterium]
KSLLVDARKLLAQLGYSNVLFKAFDGTLGWKEYAPFDAIMVTAGAPSLPEPLMDQLADNGRMVIPIGDRYTQELIKVTRKGEHLEQESLGGCRFVNLIGIHGWKD